MRKLVAQKEVDKETINKKLSFCRKERFMKDQSLLSKDDFINTKIKKEEAIYKICKKDFLLKFYENGSWTEYIFHLDGSEPKEYHVDGGLAYRTLKQYVPDLHELEEDDLFLERVDDKPVWSASGIYYSDPKYDKTRIYAYEYDINSAYSAAMCKPMPDTRNPLGPGRVEEGQIGFNFDCEDTYKKAKIVRPGKLAMHRFNLVESPFQRFVSVWYDRKKTAKTKAAKQKAKDILNMCIGELQNKNPWIRWTVVEYCNEFIRNLINEDTVYCNTDCIVSITPRNDLDVGKNLGQFKLEREGEFAYRGLEYQWDHELPTYRSIPKNWFPEGWDIIKDEIPHYGNFYEYDKEKNIIYGVKKSTKEI